MCGVVLVLILGEGVFVFLNVRCRLLCRCVLFPAFLSVDSLIVVCFSFLSVLLSVEPFCVPFLLFIAFSFLWLFTRCVIDGLFFSQVCEFWFLAWLSLLLMRCELSRPCVQFFRCVLLSGVCLLISVCFPLTFDVFLVNSILLFVSVAKSIEPAVFCSVFVASV